MGMNLLLSIGKKCLESVSEKVSGYNCKQARNNVIELFELFAAKKDECENLCQKIRKQDQSAIYSMLKHAYGTINTNHLMFCVIGTILAILIISHISFSIYTFLNRRKHASYKKIRHQHVLPSKPTRHVPADKFPML